jgi:hypothetical protein
MAIIPENKNLLNQKTDYFKNLNLNIPEKNVNNKYNLNNQSKFEMKKPNKMINNNNNNNNNNQSLDFKKCEFCNNIVENLYKHLQICPAKKIIEAENSKYKAELRKQMENDSRLANQLSKNNNINYISKDLEMAKRLQRQMGPIMNTKNDLEIARKLQKQMGPIMNTKNDLEIAKKLQKQLGGTLNTKNDLKIAKKLQHQMGPIFDTKKDEEIAKKLQKQFGYGPNTSKDDEIARKLQREFNEQNIRENNQNINDLDDDLIKALEQSKNDY